VSDTDSFIDEVTEEVRRDRLFAQMRRYGWIAVLAVLLLVGGAAYKEWRKAQATTAAEALGDAMMAALESNEAPARIAGLGAIDSQSPTGMAIVGFMTAAEEHRNGDIDAAAARLDAIAAQESLPMIYRQLATFKSLNIRGTSADIATRRAGYQALSGPGAALRLLAEEQLALLDIEEGNTQLAIDRLQAILIDAQLTPGLRRRASQLIVALGGTVAATPGGEATLAGQ
jgi:hypothetical protein